MKLMFSRALSFIFYILAIECFPSLVSQLQRLPSFELSFNAFWCHDYHIWAPLGKLNANERVRFANWANKGQSDMDSSHLHLTLCVYFDPSVNQFGCLVSHLCLYPQPLGRQIVQTDKLTLRAKFVRRRIGDSSKLEPKN